MKVHFVVLSPCRSRVRPSMNILDTRPHVVRSG